jgi:hypothetical protein
MALSYPLNTPTNIGIANITFSAENAVTISQSPFTFQQQVVAHPGQRWAASIALPPMKRQDAEYWVAFLLSLKGQIGTFLLGDPNCVTAQGSASTAPGTPVVEGANQTGGSLAISGLPASATGYLLPGDYIQIGSASTTQLYKVLTQVDSDASGGATLDIWPNLRGSPPNSSLVTISNTKGKFRLSNNIQQWQINEISSYGITFDCVEAL